MLIAAAVIAAGGIVSYVIVPQIEDAGTSTVSPRPSASDLPAPPTPSLSPTPSVSPTPDRSHSPDAADGTALEVLTTLPVKGRAPKTGYERDQFGQRWLDVDRNGCDTRNDVLGAQLTDVVRQGRCKVLTGTLADPFTGTEIVFVRGQSTSQLVQIDHVVALSDAWQKGAQALTPEQRTMFANDPLNLLAVEGRANRQKGDGDAATWLPPNKAFRCEYVARQIAVKARYALWVTQPEQDAIARVLAECPGQPLPG